MNTATKTGIDDVAKTTSKGVYQNIAEATGDLIGNKIANKIASIGETKKKESKVNQMKNKKFTYHQKKDNKKTWLKIALTPFKNGIQKITNLLYTTSD